MIICGKNRLKILVDAEQCWASTFWILLEISDVHTVEVGGETISLITSHGPRTIKTAMQKILERQRKACTK